jgi:hypothetical protein
MTEFVRCDSCGIIFQQVEAETTCPKCLERAGEEEQDSGPGKLEILRQLKNIIRDAEASGSFFTVDELSDKTGIEVPKIWEFIHSGEINTARFDDPQVRDYIVRKRREQQKAMRGIKEPSPPPSASNSAAKIRGFHSRPEDDKKR